LKDEGAAAWGRGREKRSALRSIKQKTGLWISAIREGDRLFHNGRLRRRDVSEKKGRLGRGEEQTTISVHEELRIQAGKEKKRISVVFKDGPR